MGRDFSRPHLPDLPDRLDLPGFRQNVNRNPICPTRCSGRRKSPENVVGWSSAESATPELGTIVRARKPLGLIALNRLNTSAIAETCAWPPSRKIFSIRTFVDVWNVPRPQ